MKRIVKVVLDIVFFISLTYTVVSLVWAWLPEAWTGEFKHWLSAVIGLEPDMLLPIGLTGSVGLAAAASVKTLSKAINNSIYEMELKFNEFKSKLSLETKNTIETDLEPIKKLTELLRLLENRIEKREVEMIQTESQIKGQNDKIIKYLSAILKKNISSKVVSKDIKQLLEEALNDEEKSSDIS